MTMASTFKTFLLNSSLRGVGKLVKTSGILRILWAVYVLLMLATMIYTIHQVLSEYNEGQTSIMGKVIYNAPLLFPAVTVCNYNPFSKRAEQIWNQGNIMSPTTFHKNIRNITKKLLLKDSRFAYTFFHLDNIRLYYQNIKSEDADIISYKPEELFVFCMVRYGYGSPVYRKGNLKDCKLKYTRFSHSKYFNCYTIEANDLTLSRQITELTLVIKFTNGVNRTVTKRAFVHNVFDQAYGSRVQIHESKTYPDMQANRAVNIGPGKLVEVTYTQKEFEELETDEGHCSSLTNVNTLKIVDLYHTYLYSHGACVNSELNKVIIDKCGCMMAYYPRPFLPNSSIPYCGNFDANKINIFVRRIRCISKIQLSDNKANIRKFKCLPRCTSLHFEMHESTIPWQPQFGELLRLKELNKIWIQTRSKDLKGFKQDQKFKVIAIKKLLKYLDNEDMELGEPNSDKFIEGDLSCLVISRPNYELKHQKEHLILSMNGLVSRIGGLCSLTLGLTCAFFFEVVEHIYKMIQDYLKEKKLNKNISLPNVQFLENDTEPM